MRLRMRCLVSACFSALALLAQAVPSQSDVPPSKSPASAAPTSEAKKADEDKSIATFTKDMQHLPGFVAMHVDRKADRIYFELSAFEQELLYATAQASGLGSNPIGLDRGSLGPQHVIEFRRAGKKVLVMAKNLRFRALSDNPRERLAVAESFAPSVIASLPIKAETGDAVVVDATDFVVRDATDAGGRLGGAKASYKVDKARSALWLERTKAFPDNSEVEVLLTFTSSKPNREVSRAANGKAVSLRQHHSFIRLPDNQYQPRQFDPRVGYFGPQFQDYAAPIGESMHRHYIARHRLVKKNLQEPVSDPVEPIIYYIDPGTPEPIRSALKEGAMWWADAFAAAGFRDAFQVEILPADADPMDVRYNMIHWVHRRTRGWSYGASISDPRTGEIIKGNVLLGSLRVRQDHMKFIGLQSPYSEQGACAAAASPSAGYLIDDDDLAQKVALMRIRQLAAHEVGHTLGLSHNFAASTYGRESVMDYPAPLVSVTNGELDFSAAYDVGIGQYDTWAIVYGYSQFHVGADEATELDRIVQVGLRKGFTFLTDQDARSAATSHPRASLWDNGDDPVQQLESELRVRALGLRKFGIDALRPGTTLATLEDTLVPLYLHHRFQLEAATKMIGGVDYRHAVKGDGQLPTAPIPEEQQRRALAAVLGTLKPEFLQLNPRLLARIPPAPPGHPSTAERFPRSTGQLIDPIAMASVAAEMTIRGLLNPQRAARLQNRDDGQGVTFVTVLYELSNTVFPDQSAANSVLRRLQRTVQAVLVDRLIDLARNTSASAGVRALAEAYLGHSAQKAGMLSSVDIKDVAAHSHHAAMQRRIQSFLQRQDREPKRAPSLASPPGSPIGSDR
ncbi:MAG: hypothetical protein ACI9SE_000498 [Neolewinella sp.]|jgi:hypothetical protein